MKKSQVFPSNYLGKEDLASPLTVTIGDVRMETVKGDGADEEKAVLHFAEKNLKPMILNNTNWTTLEEAYGDDSDFWRGKPAEIYVDPGVMYGGKRVGGVRLRTPPKTNNNGKPVSPTLLTWDQAISACGLAGITKEELVAHLKSIGKPGFNSVRDTKDVEAFIASKAASKEESFYSGEKLPGESDIPF